MPRYFFHAVCSDPNGRAQAAILPDLNAARRAAGRLAWETFTDKPAPEGSPDFTVICTDVEGRTLFQLHVQPTAASAR